MHYSFVPLNQLMNYEKDSVIGRLKKKIGNSILKKKKKKK